MTRENVPLIGFNRGLLSPLALSRVDLKRTAMSSQIQSNWMPRVLGSMMLRPGLAYTGGTYNNLAAIHIPFVFSTTDKAILEFTDNRMRVKLSGTAITYPSVSSAVLNSTMLAYITNGTFATDTDWTKGAGWTIAAGVADAAGALNTALSQNSGVTLVAGKSYSLTFTMTRAAGTLTASIGGTNGTGRTTSNTFTETIIAGATQVIAFTGTGFTGTVDSVSITPIDTGWVDTDEAGGTSDFSSGYMTLVGNGPNSGIREQTMTVGAPDQNVEHCLKVIVTQGPVTFTVGSTTGGDDYVTKTVLGTGEHYLAFTPTGASVYIRFASSKKYTVKVDSCAIFTGELGVATNWDDDDITSMRWDQSADVVYVACHVSGVPQYKIERRSTRSWSVVNYEPIDGPFRIQNTTAIRITPSAISGDITLTASAAAFKSTNVGGLYQLPSVGQLVQASVTAEDQWSDPIRLDGLDAGRNISVSRTGTWVATVTLQQSVGDIGSWVDVTTYTTNAVVTYNDTLDNQIIYYRIGVKAGGFTSGTAVLSLTLASGSITGVARITAFTSATVVSAIVVKELGGTAAVLDWREGDWSPRRGYPSCVAFHEGRLWWAGKSKIWGSESDAYEGFDPDLEGDAKAISRSIGSGPVDGINFLMSLNRLLMGTDGAEWTIRSTSFDEPITASNFNLKAPSTQGSDNLPAIKVDDRGLFVQRCGTKLYQLSMEGSGNSYSTEYTSANLCEIVPEIGEPGIIRIAAQRQPDTRIHCVLADGRVSVLVSEPAEEVKCWLRIETDGMVEDVFTLPGTVEDEVYYLVRRRIGGSTVRYLEKWAMETECKGGTINKQADSFVLYDSTATGTITGLTHLEGESVVCWGDGVYQGEYIVASGEITLADSVTVRQAITGKDYEAPYLSSKLAYAAQQGTALTKQKKVDHVGLILADTHASGLRYGSSLRAKTNNFLYSDQLDNAKWTKTSTTISANAVANPLDSAVTADKVVEVAASAEHLISQVANLRQRDNNVFSVYAKAAGQDYIRLKMTGDGGTVSAFFNLSTGAVVAAGMDNTGTGTGIRASIEAVTNQSGWYRCEITGICDTAGTFGVTGTVTLSSDGSTISYLGDITKGAYIFRAQIEPGKEASEPVITTTRKAKEYQDLDNLPEVEEGATVDEDHVWDSYDQPGIEFPGVWNTDSRLALLARAPKPVTVLAAIVDIKTNG